MQVFFLLLACLQLAPAHDFHTTILNFVYDADEKSYQIDLEVDTEQFSYALDRTYGRNLRMGEPDEDPACDSLIQALVNAQIQCRLNRRSIRFELDTKEVTFAESVLHFKPVRYRWKLCKMHMDNNLLIDFFPKQKNLVNLAYKDRKYSMLFDFEHRSDVLKVN